MTIMCSLIHHVGKIVRFIYIVSYLCYYVGYFVSLLSPCKTWENEVIGTLQIILWQSYLTVLLVCCECLSQLSHWRFLLIVIIKKKFLKLFVGKVMSKEAMYCYSRNRNCSICFVCFTKIQSVLLTECMCAGEYFFLRIKENHKTHSDFRIFYTFLCDMME